MVDLTMGAQDEEGKQGSRALNLTENQIRQII